MEAFKKIQLAFKCPKALDDLQPCQNNWYCDGCKKMVYDFRGFSEEAILETFAQSGQKLCGIYDAERMKILPQTAKWYRWAPAAVMTLGVTVLNSCGWGNKSNKHTVGEVAVKNKVTSHMVGVVLMPPPDSATKGKVLTKDEYIKNHKNGAMSQDLKVELYNQDKPQYPGGDAEFNRYMTNQIKNPKKQNGRH